MDKDAWLGALIWVVAVAVVGVLWIAAAMRGSLVLVLLAVMATVALGIQIAKGYCFARKMQRFSGINDRDYLGRTPLHYAVSEVDEQLVLTLLANGANPNARDTVGLAPLHGAIGLENARLVAVLLRHGAVIDEQCWALAEECEQASVIDLLREHQGVPRIP